MITTGRTETRDRVRGRTWGRLTSASLVVGALAVAGVGLGAGAAVAKSAISISVRSHIVTVGRAAQVSASGDSDDFGGTPIQLCVDERVGGGAWQQLRCVSTGSMQLDVRTQHRGELQFRSQLIAVVNPHHRVLDRTSGTVAVWVH
jgi:hypothetical protein